MADVRSEGSLDVAMAKAEAMLKDESEVEILAGVVDVPGKKLENNLGSFLIREDRSWRAPSSFLLDTHDPSTSSSILQHSSSSSGLFFDKLTPSYPVDSFSEVVLSCSNLLHLGLDA